MNAKGLGIGSTSVWVRGCLVTYLQRGLTIGTILVVCGLALGLFTAAVCGGIGW